MASDALDCWRFFTGVVTADILAAPRFLGAMLVGGRSKGSKGLDVSQDPLSKH